MQFIDSWLQNVQIRNKLILGFSVLIALLLFVAISNYTAIVSLLDRFNVLNTAASVSEHIGDARSDEKSYLLNSDPQFITAANQSVEKALQISATLSGAMSHPESLSKVQELQRNTNQYLEELSSFMTINENGEKAQREMERAAREAVTYLRDLQTEIEQTATERINQSGDRASIQALALSKQIGTIVENMLLARNSERNYVLRGNDAALKNVEDQIRNVRLGTEQLMQELNSPALKEKVNFAETEISAYERELEAFKRIHEASQQAQQVMTREAREAVRNANTSVELQLEQLRNDAASFKTILVATVVGAIALGILVVVIITRQIVTPVTQVVEASSRLANGDLTVALQSDRKDEMGDLIRSNREMTEKMKGLLVNMVAGVTQLATASEELSAVTEQNKAGVETQRLETEQVATAVEEMTSTAMEIARNAEETSATTNESSEQAKNGDKLVNQTTAQIGELTAEIQQSAKVIQGLKTESENIDSILDVIKEITEMTNLLALNAAIEAARAGEAGRGFAVVAQEVRTLAQRTQDSTNQIEGLIDSLQQSTIEAVDSMGRSEELADKTISIASETRDAIAEITSAIGNIQDRNYQVAAAASQQSTVAEDINRKIVNIRDVADETATATNQTAAAALDLSGLSSELHHQTQQFKLESGDMQQAQDKAAEAQLVQTSQPKDGEPLSGYGVRLATA